MVDEIKPLPVLNGLDAYLFTDKEGHERIAKKVRNTWTQIIVPDFPRRDFSPPLRAKYFKTQIQRLEISDKYNYSILLHIIYAVCWNQFCLFPGHRRGTNYNINWTFSTPSNSPGNPSAKKSRNRFCDFS
jgi:hypothetical protein